MRASTKWETRSGQRLWDSYKKAKNSPVGWPSYSSTSGQSAMMEQPGRVGYCDSTGNTYLFFEHSSLHRAPKTLVISWVIGVGEASFVLRWHRAPKSLGILWVIGEIGAPFVLGRQLMCTPPPIASGWGLIARNIYPWLEAWKSQSHLWGGEKS